MSAGTSSSSSRDAGILHVLNYSGGGGGGGGQSQGEQKWEYLSVGYEPAFRTITGGIFEFGFTDSILQMWAAFLYDLGYAAPLRKFAGCVTPQETALSHRLFTAALQSHRDRTVVEV